MKNLFLLFLIIISSVNYINAQTKTLKGFITNNDGEVIGATLCFGDKMDYCTTTQRNGDFSIKLPKEKLTFNALVCYKSIELSIPSCTTYFKLDVDKWHESKRYRKRFRKSLKKQCKRR